MNRRWLALMLSPLGLILISAGRLLIISDYSTTTATTIASSGGYVNTLLGSLIPLVPLFIPYVALALLLFRQFLLSGITFVFAAFIAPTSLPLPVTRKLAVLDIHQLLVQVNDYRLITFTVMLLIGIIAYAYFRSIAEALATLLLLGVLVALFSAPAIQSLRFPNPLRSASNGEEKIVALFIHDILDEILSSSIGIAILIVLGLIVGVVLVANIVALYDSPEPFSRLLSLGSTIARAIPGLTTMAMAILATIAFFPYVYNIYPVPDHTEYYVGILRSPWLPAEKLALSAGRNYYGYELSGDSDWFVVLLARTRKIVYIPTHDILRRSVCETLSQRQLPVESPLITTFYASPPKIRYCADRKHLHK